MIDLGQSREFVQAPSGLILPSRVAEQRYTSKRPIAMDFFAGAGGFSCGFVGAGYEVVAAAEYDCAAVVTYMTNLCRYNQCKMVFVEPSDRERMEKYLTRQYAQITKNRERRLIGAGDCPMAAVHGVLAAGTGWISRQPADVPGVSFIFVGDVRKLTGERILSTIGRKKGELDTVSGGPPCQGFSRAGKQNVMDPRNSLVFEYARLILELGPKTFVMEEVPAILDMVTPEGLPVIDAFMRIIEEGGFTSHDYLKKAVQMQTGIALMRKSSAKQPDAAQARAARTTAASEVETLDLFGATA